MEIIENGKRRTEKEQREDRNSSHPNDIAFYVFSAIVSANPHETNLDPNEKILMLFDIHCAF